MPDLGSFPFFLAQAGDGNASDGNATDSNASDGNASAVGDVNGSADAAGQLPEVIPEPTWFEEIFYL